VRPMVLNGAATVTLCWRQKASHFWIMLLLVSGTADHGWSEIFALRQSKNAHITGWS
jgi:hypothetical protein